MKQLRFALIAITALVLTACRSDSFRLEARIDGLGTQNVQVIYATSDGVVADWVTANDDRISYQGSAPELTVVNVLSDNGAPIARMAVIDGDKIQLKGVFGDPMNIQYKGSKVTQRWTDFLKKHREEIESNNNAMLNIEIEKYMRENKDDVVSTLLLLYDYSSLSNTQHTDSLLNILNDDAKPLYLLSTYHTLRNARSKVEAQKHFFMFDLYDSNGTWSTVRTSGHSYSIMWFWSRDDSYHNLTVDSLKQLGKTYGSRLQIADVYVDGDTAIWRKTFKNDSTKWLHLWAPGGPKGKYLEPLNIYTTPTYLLIDSFGNYNYRGASLAELIKAMKQGDSNKQTINKPRPKAK
ncbi:MAG: hypothetical protein ACI308_01120 [Muribaculaceae bacterium]